MRQVFSLAARVAPTDATVLITGETGTGKDLLAEMIHQLSRRSFGPFVAINCGALSPSLIESELFGHEPGSFTGAQRTHRGCFERAHRGTLFLDEITEMPVDLQLKLLRAIESSTVIRVGGEDPIPAEVRLLAASNRSPGEEVAARRFRADLFYRLDVFSLHLPPLRCRGDDIIDLAQHFLARLNRTYNTHRELESSALDRLRGHAWPGNVRELKNIVEHAFILADRRITADCLPSSICEVDATSRSNGCAIAGPAPHPFVSIPLGTSLAEMRRRLILATLKECGGNKRRAAGRLGVSLKTLYNRLREYG